MQGFNRCFIYDFSKISFSLSRLLQKEVGFDFDGSCKKSFDLLKKHLTSTPIIQPPNWEYPFELICDVSNYAIGASFNIEWTRNLMSYDMPLDPCIQTKQSTPP